MTQLHPLKTGTLGTEMLNFCYQSLAILVTSSS